jgi:hypothetical protein
MNNPNAEKHGHERVTPKQYVENVRHRLSQAEQFRPAVHQQLVREFQEFSPPIYSTLRGQNKATYLQAAEKSVMLLAAAAQRAPTEAETTAMAEFSVKRLDNFTLYKWGATALAGFFTWRGADKFKFPFIKEVKFAGRWNPIGGSPRVKGMMHLARFVAYYGVTWVMLDPLYIAIDHRRSMNALKEDERLRVLQSTPSFMEDYANHDQVHDQSQDAQSYSASPNQQPSYPSYSGVTSSPTSNAWSRQNTPTASQETDSWSGISDNDDISSDTPNGQAGSPAGSGSAWDRIRGQSRTQSNQGGQRAQSSWGGPQPSNPWGAQPGSPYFRNEGPKSPEKDDAQRQFDELLERERQGSEAEKGGWGGK